MARKIVLGLAAALLFYVLLYPILITTLISGVQGLNSHQVQYSEETPPKDRKAEIIAVAFGGLIDQREFSRYYYMAADLSSFGELSREERGTVLAELRKFHRRPVLMSHTKLRRIGLALPHGQIQKGCLFKIDRLEYVDDNSITMEVSFYTAPLGGCGEKMKLKFVDGHWVIDSIIYTYIS